MAIRAGVRLNQDTSSAYRPTVMFASGAAVSSPFRTYGARGFSVVFPSAWTAADIGIEFSNARNEAELATAEWHPVRGADDTPLRIKNIPTTNNPRPSKAFDPEVWQAGVAMYVRLTSLNTSTYAAVNQAAARELTVHLLS